MRTEHHLTARCICPVDGEPDQYAVTVETVVDIPVEAILAAASSLAAEKIFQEEFTRRLARKLGAVAVTTSGLHSGVRTICRVTHE